MAKSHRIVFGDDVFQARSGQRLLDAALASGVDHPHDCRAGRCGSCATKVRSGITLGGNTQRQGTIHACQALVFSDLEIEVEPLPPVVLTKGRVARVVEIGESIVEVTIAPQSKLEILPGQYCRFAFRGHPFRPFSPTAALSTLEDDGTIRLNVKKVRNGRVTPLLGDSIKVGHGVSIEGPLGSAFLRPGLTERLVLVGSGTGFAPVWAVAAAALRENPERAITLIAASRTAAAFYMGPALGLASRYKNVQVLGCIEDLPWGDAFLKPGRVTGHLPQIEAGDIVYAAGGPSLVEAVGQAAASVAAPFYADPFETAAPQPSWMDKARAWLSAS